MLNKQKLLEWLNVSIEGVPCKHISLPLLREEIQSGRFDVPSDDRLRAALEDIRDHAVRFGLATVHLKAEKALSTTEPSGAQNVPHVELDDLPFTRHACGDVGCPVCGIGAQRVREPVSWFAEQMEAKLRENDHKGGWEDCDYEYLANRLEEEVEELRALEGDPDVKGEKIIRECADIANFAMMIADNIRRACGINAPEKEE